MWDVLRKIEDGFYLDMDQSAEDIAARIRRVLLSIHVDHQNIGALSLETACAADQTTIHDTVKTITAVIHLAIHTAKAALEQIEAGADNWLFCSAPMALAGVRSLSQKPASDTKKIIDTANSQTFVAYDAVQKLLVIQIDAADCGTAPRAFVKWSDRTIEVELEKRENLFWGQVRDLPEGEYEILLEK